MSAVAHARVPVVRYFFAALKACVAAAGLAALLVAALPAPAALAQATMTVTGGTPPYAVNIPGAAAPIPFYSDANARRLIEIYDAMQKAAVFCDAKAYDENVTRFNHTASALHDILVDRYNTWAQIENENRGGIGGAINIFNEMKVWVGSGFSNTGVEGQIAKAITAYNQAKNDYDSWGSAIPLLPKFPPNCNPPGATPQPPPPPTPPVGNPPGGVVLPTKQFDCLTTEAQALIAQLDGQIAQEQKAVDDTQAQIDKLTTQLTDLLLQMGKRQQQAEVQAQIKTAQAALKQHQDNLDALKAYQAKLKALPPCKDKQTGMLIPAPGGVYVALRTGSAFAHTGKFTNTDLGDGASASFGNGFVIGAEVGVPVAPGLNLGVTGLYTSGLAPVFTGGEEQATGSAHAATFLATATIFPLQLQLAGSQASAAAGPVQPFVDFGLGASVNTMGELTGHSFGMPTGIGPGETTTNFAWRAGAGLQLDTGIPGLTASIGYDYTRLGTFSTTSSFNLFSGMSITRPPFKVDVGESVVSATLIYHFGTAPPPPPPAAMPTPLGQAPRNRQVVSLAPVLADAVTTAAAQPSAPVRVFTIRFDDRVAALSPSSIRSLDEAAAAMAAGEKVEISIAGCDGGADGSDRARCARMTASVRQLLAQRGVRAPQNALAAAAR